MSYSYLQSVFPNYKPSHKLSELIYNDIVNTNTIRPSSYEAANDVNKEADQAAPVSFINSEPLIVDKQVPESEQLNKMQKNESNETKEKTLIETFQDNLKFYNEPLQTSIIETLETEDTIKCDVNCVDHINHVLKCEGCLAILKQKLGVRSDFNDYLEIGLYILFGLLILAMLDKVDRR